MKDFILGLYANENFPIYLGTIILVLLVAFFVVFFLGKKDKEKIEKTQRLETITDDAFKNVSTPVAVDVPAVETPSALENQNDVAPVVTPESIPAPEEIVPPVVPAIPEVPASVVDENITEPVPTVVEPVIPETTVPEVNIPTVETTTLPSEPVIEVPSASVAEVVDPDAYKSPQTIDKLMEEKPVPKFDPEPVIEPYIPEPDLSNFNELASSIESELTALEKQQEIAKPIIENVQTPVLSPEVGPVLDVVVSPEVPVIEMPVAPVVNEEIVNAAANPVIETPVVEPIAMPVAPVEPILQPVQTEEIKVQPEPEKPVTANPTKVMTDIFSSVYVPKKENSAPVFEDTMAIELPKLKDTNE